MPGGYLPDPAWERCEVRRTFVHHGICTAIAVGGSGGIEHPIWRFELCRAERLGSMNESEIYFDAVSQVKMPVSSKAGVCWLAVPDIASR
jgi:hypothetical protein